MDIGRVCEGVHGVGLSGRRWGWRQAGGIRGGDGSFVGKCEYTKSEK